ncbi:MAG: hypothetical protein ACR2JA_14615, partial [Hydrogenophaga sp.]|uniref:hypothetical protein n=1 Tax=Hydrogenophaga sp. TaxID=1904254 RepID=UPI003D9BFD2E
MREQRWVPPAPAPDADPALPGPARPARVAYFVHHAEDPAYRRRIAMLRAGGAQVAAFGFAPAAHAQGRPENRQHAAGE